MLPYADVIYKMKPVREVEPGWWKLRWRPIKNGTWNAYTVPFFGWPPYRQWGCRFSSWKTGGGYGRSWDGKGLTLDLWFFRLGFWLCWNFIVHKDGPSDVADGEQRPLNIPKKGE